MEGWKFLFYIFLVVGVLPGELQAYGSGVVVGEFWGGFGDEDGGINTSRNFPCDFVGSEELRQELRL